MKSSSENTEQITEQISLFQAGGLSHSTQKSSPLDSLSAWMRKSASLCNIFTSRKHKSKRDHPISEDSVIEEDYVNTSDKTEGSGLQTCSLNAALQTSASTTTSDSLSYEAESPDEAALVHAAKAYGFILLARTPESVTVRLPSGEELVFEVLDTLTFDSNRKRMSVLVRHPITKECVLYTKGADYAIMELLGSPYAGTHTHITHNINNIWYHITLCFGQDGAIIMSYIIFRTSQWRSEEDSCRYPAPP